MKHILPICLLLCLGYNGIQAQGPLSAMDTVPAFSDPFCYGSNMGYFPPWEDESLADIAAGNPEIGVPGIGVKSLRPALPAWFLEQFGYDVRINTFQHYEQLGIRNNTVFIGYPSEEHRDTNYYCPTHRSETFANLYTDIWDNGENGTPVNDENYYALYLYKMVSRYKDYITFWEIWNEPDFDYSSNAWREANMSGNWWTNNPDPCDYALRAPVYHYVRMLRISYEVIKRFDPDGYVAVGGLGFPSYLDAIMRNTDNPQNGLASEAYPLKGGAYFDVLSFHAYPHVDGSLRDWNNDLERFVYFRHSDAATQGVIDVKKEFETVLIKYGYGVNLPQKEFIITECNVPRVAFAEKMGSNTAQRNFIIKTLIAVQQENVRQFCVYDLSDGNPVNDATSEFQLMGMFKYLSDAPPYQQIPNDIAIAYKTTSDLLYGSMYAPMQTDALILPNGAKGAAFEHPDGSYTYVLWAATKVDRSEDVSLDYTFSPLIPTDSMEVFQWDYSSTNRNKTPA